MSRAICDFVGSYRYSTTILGANCETRENFIGRQMDEDGGPRDGFHTRKPAGELLRNSRRREKKTNKESTLKNAGHFVGKFSSTFHRKKTGKRKLVTAFLDFASLHRAKILSLHYRKNGRATKARNLKYRE